ncbi:MAG: formylglycine-generating enzyme family protein [Planctomycetia bacterium]|nr:formylglycine-generating enzyme family protein [Planctomycetia bacterium]
MHSRNHRIRFFKLLIATTCFTALIAFTLLPLASSEDKPTKKVPTLTRPEMLKLFADEFVPITPGEGIFPAKFQMGSDRADNEMPAHEVTLKHKFAIAKYEIPQNLWEAVMGSNPSKWKGPRNSVEMFSWKDACEFCNKITQMLQTEKVLGLDEEIRLPSEAEWEYCCRAGTQTVYSFGDEATKDGDAGNKASRLNEFGWHTGNAAGNDPPVGALKPNPWGLYDMHGYLWEFVEDSWHPTYADAPTNGRAWKEAAPKQVVARSGSWKDHYLKLTSSARAAVSIDAKDDAIGLRCVRAKKK